MIYVTLSVFKVLGRQKVVKMTLDRVFAENSNIACEDSTGHPDYRNIIFIDLAHMSRSQDTIKNRQNRRW